MNTILEQINSTGKAFVEFAVPMLVQSSVLIVILLLVDLALRKKVKAVFRYCIWMLVLLKLILPTSLSSPLSLGYWFGDHLAYVAESRTAAAPEPEVEEPALADMLHIIEPVPIEEGRPTPAVLPMMPGVELAEAEPVSPPTVSVTPVTWQGIVFLVWLAVVIALGLLLLQRAMFVRGLVAQAKEANSLMNNALEYCCKCMGVKRKIGLKVSANAASPAVCGLFRPVILVPQNLGPSLGAAHLRTVLLHELAHIKRGDLWANLAQAILQIIYFYNPFVWLANAMIRRVREQAIDETVLVAMGEKAQQYPQTLVNVAKLAFKRPVLSLRLIGVVESKSALAGRIKHILNRPMPKSAKLGIVGVLAVLIAGAVLLPMAAAAKDEEVIAEEKKQEASQFVAKLPSGVTVELVGVCEHPSEGKQWWRPDGTLLNETPYKTTGSLLPEHANYRYCEFVIRLQDADDISIKWDVPGGRQSSFTSNPMDANGQRISDLQVYTVNQPEDQKTALVRIGLSTARWQTIATHPVEIPEETYSIDENEAVAFGRSYEKDSKTVIPVTHNINRGREKKALRVVAVTYSGREVRGSVSGRGGNILSSNTHEFNLPLRDIKEFRFQTRSYEWVEFRNVSLRPGVKTDVQVEVKSVPYTQEMFNDIQPDSTILFKTTVRQINRTGREITTTGFINSDFVHVTGMSDAKGRPIKFTAKHEGDIYRYKLTFNEPVPPGELMEYSHEGKITGLVKRVAGKEDQFEYRMRHWPAAGQPTLRIETYLLPEGAQLISTTPEDMQRRTKDGRIELHVEKMIPAGGSITTAFQYRLTGGKAAGAEPLKLNPAPWADGEVVRMNLNTMVGMEIGTIVYIAESVRLAGEKVWRVESYMVVPINNTQQFTRVDAQLDSFAPITGRTKNQLGDFKAKYEPNKVKLVAETAGKETIREIELDGVAYDNEQVLYLIRRLPLEEGYKVRFPIFPVQGGAVVDCAIEVTGKEKVTVPAGTFDCYAVDLAVYSATIKALEHTLWLSADKHSYFVKYDSGQAIMELNQVDTKKAGTKIISDSELNLSVTIPADWHCYKSTSVPMYKLYWQLLPPELKAWGLLVGVPLELGGISARVVAEGDVEVLKGFFKDYAVRENSWQELKIDEIPAAQYIADYVDKEGAMVEYRTYLLDKSKVYWFVFRIEKDKFEAARSEFDSIVNSFKLKQ